MLPFERNLFSRTFAYYYLFLIILRKEVWTFLRSFSSATSSSSEGTQRSRSVT